MNKVLSVFVVLSLALLASCESFSARSERTARDSKGRLLHIPPEIK